MLTAPEESRIVTVYFDIVPPDEAVHLIGMELLVILPFDEILTAVGIGQPIVLIVTVFGAAEMVVWLFVAVT